MTFNNRELSHEIKEMAKKYPIVTVIGPRQSGKTTLVRQLFSHKPYLSLENPDDRMFASQDPKAFLARYPEGAVFDEVQRVPEILSYIQTIVDERKMKGMFILTGSHQLDLQNAVNQSLAGRTAMLKLLPYSISELPIAHKFDLDDHLFHGMYPRIFADQIMPSKFYRDYVQTYIERDVRQIINIKDLGLFRKFLKLCAGRIGQVFNSSNLSNELGVSSHTVKSWLSVIEASFIVFQLPPYFENFGKRVIKGSKLYFYDVGLASYLLDVNDVRQISRDPLRGNLVENLVVSEIFKKDLNKGIEPNYYFFRESNGNEVDLIYKVGNQLIPIEIKSSQTFHKSFLKGIKYFVNLVGEDRSKESILIYSGEQEQNIGDCQIINYKNIVNILKNID